MSFAVPWGSQSLVQSNGGTDPGEVQGSGRPCGMGDVLWPFWDRLRLRTVPVGPSLITGHCIVPETRCIPCLSPLKLP